jgi:phage terminase large subunit GpA-like protein
MAFRPPEKLSVSDWADHHRVLPDEEPGRAWAMGDISHARTCARSWTRCTSQRCARSPSARATQVGGTEALLNCLGWSMDQDPDPAVYLMPTDKARDDFMRDRVKPMVELSPRLRPLKSSRKADWKKDRA